MSNECTGCRYDLPGGCDKFPMTAAGHRPCLDYRLFMDSTHSSDALGDCMPAPAPMDIQLSRLPRRLKRYWENNLDRRRHQKAAR
jgi:hypothetical protein